MQPRYLNARPALPTRLALLATSVLLLSGCAIYSPTVPATPILEKGQVEVSAGARLFALEATAAWAPTNHLLIVAEGARRNTDGTNTRNGQTYNFQDYHNQGGIGLGYYHAPTATMPTYLAVVGGVGFATTHLQADYDELAALPIPTPDYGYYYANYRRYYGQAYVAWPSPQHRVTAGASLRGTVVDYTTLTLSDVSVNAANHFFLEPTGFLRIGRGPVRFQFTGGLSLPFTYNRLNPHNSRTASSSVLLGFMLVLRPDLFLKQE